MELDRIGLACVEQDERPDPKHTHTVYDIPDDDLLRRAIRNVRHKKGAPRWSGIAEAFALGSTYSMQLCCRFDLDPHEIVRR